MSQCRAAMALVLEARPLAALRGCCSRCPLTAIAGSWLEGHAITVYGLGAIGPLFTLAFPLGHQILEVHQLLANTILVAAGLHAAAALFHHFFMKDGVLRAMLPGGRAGSAGGAGCRGGVPAGAARAIGFVPSGGASPLQDFQGGTQGKSPRGKGTPQGRRGTG